MDAGRLDTLTRDLVGATRRAAVLGLAGLLGTQHLTDAVAKKGKKQKKCKGRTKKCGKRCIDRAAACPPAPDAACPANPGSVSGYAWYLYTAQTFTEPNGGRLQAAELWMRNTSASVTGTYELLLYRVDRETGVPQNGTTLAVASLPTSQVSASIFRWVRFTFPNQPRLAPGTQYALVLRTIGGSGFEGYVFEHQSPDPCPGGEFFVSNGPEDEFSPRSGTDIAYRTVVKG